MNKLNIILIHAHDLGRHLGCYGEQSVDTPNLNSFAASGVRFSNSFCTSPSCSPSRGSLFTGRYPHVCGVMGLTQSPFDWDLYPGEKHIAGILKDNGYNTASVGIIHESSRSPEKLGYKYFNQTHDAVEISDTAVQLMKKFKKDKEAPFFLNIGFLEPHRLPSDTVGRENLMIDEDHDFLGEHLSSELDSNIDIPGYLKDTPGTRREISELNAALNFIDSQFKKVIDCLEEEKLKENTLVIFTSDHGIALPGAKCSLYDPGISIPIILSLPSREGWFGGIKIDHMVSSMDILPSILKLLNIENDNPMNGLSFTGLLDGEDYNRRTELFTQMTYHDYYDPRRSIRTDKYKLILNFSSAPSIMDPSQSWRPRSEMLRPNPKAHYHKHVELYDLEKDPWEMTNIAESEDYKIILKTLLMKLLNLMKETSDPLLDGAVLSPHHKKTMGYLDE